MRSKHCLGLLAVGLTTLALASGCGDDAETTSTSGAGGSATTSTTTTTGGGSDATTTTTGAGGDATTTTTTGGGGIPDDGNNSFETAEEFSVDGGAVQADLDPAATDLDFFKFTGTKDQALFFLTDCKPDDDPYADGYPDLVITLFDANKQQIAQNDDPFPRNTQDSSLVTILPADGDYYVQVSEFCASDLATTPCPDTYFDDLFETAYALAVITLDPASNGNVLEAVEPNDTLLTSTPMEYEAVDPVGSPGDYYLSLTWGAFGDNTDIDAYLVNLPADLNTSGSSPVAQIAVYPNGPGGNGATSPVGLISLIDPVTMKIVAQVDAAVGGDLTPPVGLGTDYLLTVEHPGTAAGAHDFYFLNHNGTAFLNQDETELTTENNLAAGAEALVESPQSDGSSGYFAQGDLLVDPLDVADYFKFDVIGAGNLVTVACGAQRSGSGLRGLKFTVYKGSDGTALPGGTSVAEDAFTDLVLQDVDPGTESTLLIKVEAASQDANISSSFYRCGMNVHAP